MDESTGFIFAMLGIALGLATIIVYIKDLFF